ncbi:class II myosin [Tulasnella sp. 332]|nr:class II myosin [Tulasnella sp. 332]
MGPMEYIKSKALRLGLDSGGLAMAAPRMLGTRSVARWMEPESSHESPELEPIAIVDLTRITQGAMAPSKKAGKKTAGTSATKAGKGVAKADWKEGFKKKQAGVSDMTLLTTISNESINENLQKRWQSGEIYTYIGGVLISVNPFKDLGIYTDAILNAYKGKNRLEVPPHVFSIAESAYYNMQAYKQNQCVIISGESGAGKTEAAKRIMQYIAAVSGGRDSSIQQIKEMVLATNPLLESFGCAKTLRNNNSSRHGKYLEIMFNSHGEPMGAQITNYLLEKSRVVGQIENERDFHIFYQFTKGASDAQRETFGLQGPEAYAITSRSNCLEVPGIDDVKDWHDTIKAMQVIGLTADEQNNIFRMLAVILWLGNVQFTELDDGNSKVDDTSVTEFVAYLMETDAALVEKVMTSRVVETQRGGRRGSVYDVPLNPAQANSGRDALAQAIYNNLFEWIVSRVNISMKPRGAYEQLIGVLDIYGFEIFQNNSFEQLCINYVNEKLQQIFIELTLKTEQEEYVREQIKWTPIKYFNNKIVCDLIEEKRPPGIFAALNDACATAHADPSAADNSFVQRLSALSSNPHFDSRGSQFLVKHYAGDVMYNVAGMTDKNKDSLVKDLLDLVAGTSNRFLKGLFPDRPDPNSKKRPPTAGDKIKASAGALVENLMKAAPSYIRTIKPNENRSSTEYDNKAIVHQIQYLGLQENIRVRRAGFAYRNTFEKMVERFYLLSPSTSYAGEYTWQGDPKSGCEQILRDTGIAKDEWQMGVTKAFIKNPETLFALETMRDRYWHNMAGRIQRAWRNYWRYKNECASRIQRFWKNNKEGLVYAEVREYGHKMLAGRKERRRFSLLSYRRFMGDYLDVGGQSPLGEQIRNACGIARGESIHFSMRIQLLVSKLLRSSKPSPRFLVLTDKGVHIVITTAAKDGSSQIMCERKVPLVTIKSVATSSMRDDWVALNLSTVTEEGDPVLSCYFKTEFVASLMQLTRGQLSLTVGPTVEYAKKKDKKQLITFRKDETILHDDVYKSHVVSVPSGEPPSSVSRPAAKRKAREARPITKGKLLRAGGPSGPRTTTAAKPKPKPVPLPTQSTTAPAMKYQAPTPAAPTPVSAPIAAAAVSAPKLAPVAKRQSMGIPPPPPPPPPPVLTPVEEPEIPTYKSLYAFEGQEGEMSLALGDIVELREKDENGWWMVVKGDEQGWVPSNYLELIPPKPKPAPVAARRAPPGPPLAPTPAATVIAPKPKVPIAAQSIAADSSAKPIAVFPGMGGANGGPAPWKRAQQMSTEGDSPDNSAPSSRPSSTSGTKPPAPAPKPKPKPPGIASKPVPNIPGRPPIPGATKPIVAPARPPAPSAGGGGGSGPKGPGQMDLAAALAKRAQRLE